jgi:hypothetical protein
MPGETPGSEDPVEVESDLGRHLIRPSVPEIDRRHREQEPVGTLPDPFGVRRRCGGRKHDQNHRDSDGSHQKDLPP